MRSSSAIADLIKCVVIAVLLSCLGVAPAWSAQLSGSVATTSSSVDLTAQAATDWAHWGRTSVSSFNHKASGGSLISNYTKIGSGAVYRFSPFSVGYSWSDGTPDSSASNVTAGIFFLGAGNGYRLTLPADTTPRTLKVYLGVWEARGHVQATLSDGSATAYSTLVDDASGNTIYRVVTVTYSAASAGQTLNFQFTIDSTYDPYGNVVLQAATLGGGSVGGNSVPVLQSIGNKTGTVGTALSFNISATDADGTIPLLSATNLPSGATFNDNGNGTGTFGWVSPVAGMYSNVTFKATDAVNSSLSSSEAISISISGGSGSAQLSGSVATTSSSVDLTAQAATDWAHWGRTSVSSFNHKASGGSLISNYTKIGSGAVYRFSPFSVGYSWSDGTPDSSASNVTAGIFFLGAGNGYRLTLPADTTPRTLKVYLGVWEARGHVQATLSDGSATAYSTLVDDASGNTIYRVVTVTYSAASAGQTLNFQFTIDSTYDPYGNVVLQAATLGGGSVGGNSVPVLQSIGNKTGTVGTALSFNISATDADGTIPLLSATNLPSGATFNDNGNGTGTFGWVSPVAGMYSNVTFKATDAVNSSLSSSEAISISISGGSGSAQLSGSVATTSSSVDLTAQAATDWAHWGRTSVSSFNHKASGGSLISNYTKIGSGAVYRFSPFSVGYSWSDGTPDSSASNVTAGIFFLGAGNGYRLTLPADTTPRTLKVYLGVWEARGHVQATLSDGSATAYSTLVDDASGNTIYRVVTVTYSAASAGQTLNFQFTIDSTYDPYGNVVLQAATLGGGSGGGGGGGVPLPFSDNFDDGNLNGWTAVDDAGVASDWQVINGALTQLNSLDNLWGAYLKSYHLGSYAYSASLSALTDFRFSVDATFLSNSEGAADDIGVMFRYKDANNYYRFSMNSRYGFSRFEKKVNGTLSTLAVNARGFDQVGTTLPITILAKGSSIQIWVNNEPLFAAEDSSIPSGSVAVYTQAYSRFDNVLVQSIGSSPTVALSTPVANSVLPSNQINASAVAINVPAGGYVEFLLDGSHSITDGAAPYSAQFTSVAQGNHTVEAILRNASDVEVARDTNSMVGTQGNEYIAVGDSLTNGEVDNFSLDNRTSDPRILGFQGYEANLTKLLNASTSYPNIVINEGIGGSKSSDTLSQIDSIIARHPHANKALVLIGTNDSQGTLPIPSGLGLSGSAVAGTFKGNVQAVINKLTAAGVSTPVVALVPPSWRRTGSAPLYSDPLTASRNVMIQEYNSVITNELTNMSIGPDFFSFYLSSTVNRRELLGDYYEHYNGLGYAVNAYLWHNVLNPASPVAMPFILNNITSATSAPWVQQNILELGDRYYVDEPYTLNSIPGVLQGAIWVMAANADQTNASSSFVSFQVDRPVTVYVAYDSGATSLPNWLRAANGFTDTGLSITVSGDPNTSALRLYSKNYPSGTIGGIGGNAASGAAGADSNYLLLVKPR